MLLKKKKIQFKYQLIRTIIIKTIIPQFNKILNETIHSSCLLERT